MRPLLLLTLVLVASSASAQPGWIADPKTGCRVWSAARVAGETAVWSGACVWGYADGAGTMQRFVDGVEAERYDGLYASGKRRGRGVLLLADGASYDGEFRDDAAHGLGIFTTAAGDRYEGEFRAGAIEGRGVYIFANGNRYAGDLRFGGAEGRGDFIWANGDRYEGQWRNRRPHGHGTLWAADGAVYSGQWIEGCHNADGRSAHAGVSARECGFE